MTTDNQEHVAEDTAQPFKRAKTIPSYRINTFTLGTQHPTGIKPTGNYLMEVENEAEFKQNRDKLLGSLNKFPEDLLIKFIHEYIDDPKTLKSLAHSSRLLYSYTFSEEIWRKLYINEYLSMEDNIVRKTIAEEEKRSNTKVGDSYEKIKPFGIKNWYGSWRRTILKIAKEEDEALIKCTNLIYSDILFRPYQCSQIDYQHLFKKIIDFEKKCSDDVYNYNKDFGIERFIEEDFTMDMFETKFIDKPFILKSKDTARWPNWTIEDLLEKYPNDRFRQESVNWDLKFYYEYYKKNKDESPLYLFDCNSAAMDQIRSRSNYNLPEFSQTDFFKIFNEQKHNCRPDHSWLITGPQRTGSTFHKDPNHTSAWNAGISGIKLWVMLPPHIAPPGITTDAEENEVTSPIGVAEWTLSGYYNDSVKLALNNVNNFDGVNCLIGMTFPGECIHVPAGWWHSVINVTDSVAMTENFVPRPYLPRVLHFLKTKRNQISGFHLKDFITSVKHFLEEDYREEDDNENITILKDFLIKFSDKIVTNEDCGVLDELNDFSLPLYEYFVELIKKDSRLTDLEFEDVLEQVSQLEAEAFAKLQKEQPVALKESEVWTNLVKDNVESGNTGSGFSFGFCESESESESEK